MIQSDRKLVVFVAISCILLALLGYAWKQRTSIPFVTVPLEQITTPFSYGTARALSNIHTGIEVIDNAISRTLDMESVKEENAVLTQKQSNYDEVVAENIRLRQMLNFQNSHSEYDLVVASVMTRDFGAWTNTFTIDQGSNEGIEVNMAVIVPSGVVGFVTDVYPHSARVQTILDPRTAIGVIVQRPESRLSGVVKGNGNNPSEPNMVDIASDGDVLVGDKLVTSGYGGIYPKGLPVGHGETINNDAEGFVKNAIVDTNVNFHHLEEVFVITAARVGSPEKPNLQPKLVPQTQRDQVEGVKGTVAQ